VTCGPHQQRKRLMKRYGDAAHVDRMLATQLPSRAKIPFADMIVRTNAPLDHVRRLLSEALAELADR
jgi:dephospho-CoA kinase